MVGAEKVGEWRESDPLPEGISIQLDYITLFN